MNPRNLFRVLGVILALGSFGWLFAPQATSRVEELSTYGLYITQQLGATTLAFGILLLLVSGMASSSARQAVVTAVIVQQLVAGIVNLLAVLGSAIPSGLGWFGVVFNLVFVLAFSYFRFIRPEAA